MLEGDAADLGWFHKDCEFCDEFAGGASNAFSARYRGHLKSRFVYSTSNFHIFPSIGQLTDGYLLAAPKRHYATFDEMPQDLWVEFQRLYEHVRATLFSLYGPCLSFEHGARQASSGGCGIYHAHMHLVPFPGAVDDLIRDLKRRFAWRILPKLIDLHEQDEKPASYLFVEAPDSTRYLFSASNLPSQFMRRLLSEAIGRDDWDWRIAGREQRLLATIRQLSVQFDRTRKSAHGCGI
jgi:diadenosine tetraphosphate (Ap4A) HIT family hydrolase